MPFPEGNLVTSTVTSNSCSVWPIMLPYTYGPNLNLNGTVFSHIVDL